MSDLRPTFAELLSRQRRILGVTQAQLAERAQISERAVSDIERGLKAPQPGTLRLLAGALSLSAEQVEELELVRRDRRGAPSSTRAHNFPGAHTSFVGREEVLAQVRQLLGTQDRPRLLTLTGPGGTGKTRVAVAAAEGMLDEFPDGVYFVGLAPLTDPRLVASTIAQSIGGAVDERLTPLGHLKNYLRERRLLLILDNFEQVLSAAVDIGELLTTCPRLRVLVTSRAPLRLTGEQEFAVPPMALPDLLASSEAVEADVCESVRLFVDRARAVRADFALSADNTSAVARICHRLDGLTGGASDLPARHQTLRDTIAWSYDLLEPEEQTVFRHLAVFVGGCSLDAAQAVCAGGDGVFLDVVESLVAKNLVRAVDTGAGEPRITLLETIREFGLEQLAWTGELEPVRRRHAELFLALGEEAETRLGESSARLALDQLEMEHDNLRAALEWNLSNPRSSGQGALRLSGALARFWWIGGHWGEGRRWLVRALAAAPGPTAARMKALHGAGWLAHFQRDSDGARCLLDESLAIAEHLADRWWCSWVLHTLGRVAYFDYDASTARDLGLRSLAIAETVGDRWLIAWALHLLGLAAFLADDYAAAETYYEQSLAIRRELGHIEGIVIVLHLKGMIPHRRGDLPAALALYREALDVARELNSAWFFRSVVPLLASLAAANQPARAARLGGAVTIMSESAQTLMIPLTQALFDEGVHAARRKLGEAAFAAAWAAGRAMSAEDVVAEAMAVDVPRGAYPAQLTAAEVNVLRRLARGDTTRQIADDLVIAVSTVDRHVTHIYQKIGMRGRASATAFAIEHGLA